jgi:hypothetical protein
VATIPRVISKEDTSFGGYNETSFKQLFAENIIYREQPLLITNPIDSKRISKESTKSLTMGSAIKAVLVFAGTIGSYYLAKTTGVFSYFGWGTKDVACRELVNAKKSLSVRTNLETAKQGNSLSLNQIAQAYKDTDSKVKFEKIEIEELKNLQKVKKEKNVEMRRSFSRRSISIQNSIEDKNATVGKFYEWPIDGDNIFNSSRGVSLEVIKIPTWLTSRYDMKLVGTCDIPNFAEEIVLSGNYAYISGKKGLQIVDISDPLHPITKGLYETLDYAEGLVIFENYAYVAARSSGLQIIDISDPLNPTLEGSYGTPYFSRGIAFLDDYAYMADWNLGLRIINVSNASNPIFEGSCYRPDSAVKVVVSGDYAYVGDRYLGLNIIDVSNPENPIFKEVCNVQNSLYGLAIFENYTYIASGASGLWIIDISNPLSPVFKNSYNNSLFAYGITISKRYAYTVGKNSIQIIGISNSENPILQSSYELSSNDAKGIAISGNYIYVTDEEGLKVIYHDLSKLTLSGTPNVQSSEYSVEIRGCNEENECITDRFDIKMLNSIVIVPTYFVGIGVGAGAFALIVSCILVTVISVVCFVMCKPKNKKKQSIDVEFEEQSVVKDEIIEE